MTIGSFQAKTHFSELIDNIEKEKECIITRRGKPIAVIIPYPGEKTSRKDAVRKLAQYLTNAPEKIDIKSMIEEGRK